MIEAFFRGVVRHRRYVVLGTVIVVVLAALGVRQVTFTSDYRVFFGSDNPQLAAFEKLQNTYTKNDNVLIAVVPKNGRVFTHHALQAVKELTEQAWKLPYSLRVDSITNFQHTRGVGDDLIVKDLVADPASLTMSELSEKRAIAVNEPLLVNRLISPKTDVTGINVTINLPGKSPHLEGPEVMTATRALVAGAQERYPDMDFYLTGTVALNAAFHEASRRDMRTLVPIMFGVVIVALSFLLRHAAPVLGTLSVIVFSILTTVGVMGWAGWSFTPPSAAAPTIILTLAVADSVHILISFLYHMRHGMRKDDAMVEALRTNLQPIFVTSITTAVGLLALNTSDSPPLRDLGNIVAIGVTLAWIYAFTFLPAFVTMLPIRVKTEKGRTHVAMERFADFVIRHRNAMFWGNLALIFLLTGFIWKNQLNDAFVEYFDKSTEFRQATDLVTERLTGVYFVDYSLGAGASHGVSDPAYLEKIDEFAQWARRQPEVVHVNVLTDVMKRLNQNLHGDDPAFFRIPESRALAAQYLLLYEMSLPYGLDLNNQINVDKSATRVSITLRNITTNEFLGIEQRARDWLMANAPPTMHGEGSSPGIMFSHIGRRNLDSMIPGNVTSLLLVSMTLIVAFRSLKFGVISILPNAVPILMGFGLWGLLVGEVGLSLSVVGSMTLGIVVDDTIHFISKYLYARRDKRLSPEESVRYAFSSVGTAIWVLTLVLVLGFGVLALSSFKMNAGMGLLTAMTFVIALAADFLFLPALLLKIDKSTAKRKLT